MRVFRIFKRRNRPLGLARTRLNDLGLEQKAGGKFLCIIIGLMTFLMAITLCTTFVLQQLSGYWVSGLQNKLTIEIPAERGDNTFRTQDDIVSLQSQIEQSLKPAQGIEKITILSRAEIQAFIQPWFENTEILEELPFPGLLAVELDSKTVEMNNIQTIVQNISPDIKLDGHKEWLNDLLKFTTSLSIFGVFIIFVITLITILSVSSAIRARLMIHQNDVELLHLMGANDKYITRQFQFYILRLAFKGAFIGFLCAIAILYLIKTSIQHMEFELGADLTFSKVQNIIFYLLPVMFIIFAVFTTRFTVLKSLNRML